MRLSQPHSTGTRGCPPCVGHGRQREVEPVTGGMNAPAGGTGNRPGPPGKLRTGRRELRAPGVGQTPKGSLESGKFDDHFSAAGCGGNSMISTFRYPFPWMMVNSAPSA
jgi:hypothetical protein